VAKSSHLFSRLRKGREKAEWCPEINRRCGKEKERRTEGFNPLYTGWKSWVGELHSIPRTPPWDLPISVTWLGKNCSPGMFTCLWVTKSIDNYGYCPTLYLFWDRALALSQAFQQCLGAVNSWLQCHPSLVK
jgi:hypothetical protein